MSAGDYGGNLKTEWGIRRIAVKKEEGNNLLYLAYESMGREESRLAWVS